MASFEDYDEFGNYIGADLPSDDEDDDMQQNVFVQEQQQQQPLEGFDEEQGDGGLALMQVDGMSVLGIPKLR